MPSVEAGVAHIPVSADLNPFRRNLSTGVDRAVRPAADKVKTHFGAAFKAVAVGAGALFAGSKAIGFFSSAIGEARESVKVGKLTAQVIKSTGGAAGVSEKQVGNLANRLSDLTGIDDETVQGAENLLLTFTNIGRKVFPKASGAVLDMSAALGQDTKSSAIQLGKALNDPIKGVTALQRVGVSFTKKQRDQIKALVESGDTLKAQQIILKEVNREFGGAAAASATSADKLKVTWSNLKEEMGLRLLPVLDAGARFLTNVLPPAFDAVSGVAGPFFDTIATGFSAMRSAFSGEGITSGGIVGAFEKVGVKARELRDRVGEIVTGLSEGFSGQTYGVGGDKGLEGAFKRTGAAAHHLLRDVGGLTEALKRNRDVVLPFVAALATFAGALAVFSKISAIASAIGAILGPVVTLIGAALGGSVLAIIALIAAAAAALAAGFYLAYRNIKPFHDLVDKVGRLIRSVTVKAFDKLRSVVDALHDPLGAVSDAFGAVERFVGRAQDAIGRFAEHVGSVFAPLGSQIAGAFRAGADFADAFMDRLRNVANIIRIYLIPAQVLIGTAFREAVAIVSGVLGVFVADVKAAVAVLAPLLGAVWDTFVLGARVAFALVKAAVETFFQTVRGVFEVASGVLRGDWHRIWDGLKDIALAPINAVRDNVGAALDAIVDFVRKMPGRIAQVARGMWDGIWEAFKATINFIIDAWNGIDIGIHVKIPSWVPGVGGKGFGIDDIFPDIPRLHSGGLVPGRPQQEMLALVRGGERWFPSDHDFHVAAASSGVNFNGGINISGVDDPRVAAEEASRRIGWRVSLLTAGGG